MLQIPYRGSSIQLKAQYYYYQSRLSKATQLPTFPGYYGRPTRSVESIYQVGPTILGKAYDLAEECIGSDYFKDIVTTDLPSSLKYSVCTESLGMIKAPAGVRVAEPTEGQGIEEPSVVREDILQLMV